MTNDHRPIPRGELCLKYILFPSSFLELITTQLRFHMVSPQLVLLIILTMQSYKFYLYIIPCIKEQSWLCFKRYRTIKCLSSIYTHNLLHQYWDKIVLRLDKITTSTFMNL